MRAHSFAAFAFVMAAIGIGSGASGQIPAPSATGTLAPPPAAPPATTVAPTSTSTAAQPGDPAAPAATPLYHGGSPYGPPPAYGAQPYGAQPYGPAPYGYPPGYQPYGPAWSNPGQKLPAKLDYQEGAPVPAGYHVEERIRRGPVIGGAIVGGIGYVVVGLPVLSSWNELSNSSRALAVPVLGPWITMATYERCNEGQEFCFDSLINLLLILDGAMQTTGAILLTYGLTSKKQWLIRDDLASGPRITRFGPASFGNESLGLTVGGVL